MDKEINLPSLPEGLSALAPVIQRWVTNYAREAVIADRRQSSGCSDVVNKNQTCGIFYPLTKQEVELLADSYGKRDSNEGWFISDENLFPMVNALSAAIRSNGDFRKELLRAISNEY